MSPATLQAVKTVMYSWPEPLDTSLTCQVPRCTRRDFEDTDVYKPVSFCPDEVAGSSAIFWKRDSKLSNHALMMLGWEVSFC